MPVREFKDDRGVEWRAWEITPESIHPQTKAEDYLADCFELGWVVFETKDGGEKRRLCPIPHNWHHLRDSELAGLIPQSELVESRRVERQRTAEPQPALADVAPVADVTAPRSVPPPPDPDKPHIADLGVVRSFRYPGGRLWTVCVMNHPQGGGPPVLRFTAGMRSIDIADWPRDWPDYPDERLIELMRAAAPRRGKPSPPDAPRRRHDDVQQDGA